MRLSPILGLFGLAIAAAPAIAGAQAKKFPAGSYTVDVRDNSPVGQQYKGWVFQVKPDGSMAAGDGSQTFWAANSTQKGDTLQLVDRPDTQASCGDVVGLYVWKELEGKIVFNAISDGCDGRRDGLTGILLVKQPAK